MIPIIIGKSKKCRELGKALESIFIENNLNVRLFVADIHQLGNNLQECHRIADEHIEILESDIRKNRLLWVKHNKIGGTSLKFFVDIKQFGGAI